MRREAQEREVRRLFKKYFLKFLRAGGGPGSWYVFLLMEPG